MCVPTIERRRLAIGDQVGHVQVRSGIPSNPRLICAGGVAIAR
jgi:hypothetical protein